MFISIIFTRKYRGCPTKEAELENYWTLANYKYIGNTLVRIE